MRGFARIELEDGTLLEGPVFNVIREVRFTSHTSPFSGVRTVLSEEPLYTMELRDPTTIHDWRRQHNAGEDMGVPITPPAPPETEDPNWGIYA